MRTYVLVGGLLCAVIAIPIAYFAGRGGLSSNGSPSSPQGETEVRSHPPSVFAEGRLLPAEGMIEIAMLPGEQLLELMVKPGDEVTADQPLAKSAREPIANLQWRLAVASRDEAQQQLAQQKAKAKAERVQAEATLDRLLVEFDAINSSDDGQPTVLEKKLAQAKEQLDRLKELMAREQTRSLVSRQDIEKQQLEVESLEAEMAQSKKVLQVSIDAARATLEQADEAIRILDQQTLNSFDVQVELAKQQWEMTIIKAPRKGVILKTFLEPGEIASTQPLLLMGDLDSMICIAEVFQSSMRFVQPGQSVTLTSPALAEPFEGVVDRIDRLVGESSLQNPNPLSPKDRKTADVYIVLSQEDTAKARQFVNSQVTVEIAVSPPLSSDAE